jgi:hypothetical protein
MSNPTIPISTIGNNSFAEVPWPGMPDPQLPASFHVVVPNHTAQVAVGTSGRRFNSLQFIPEQPDGTPNTGNVEIWIRVKDSADADDGEFALAETIAPDGTPFDWNPPDGYQYNGADFKIGADNNGDGVKIIYS